MLFVRHAISSIICLLAWRDQTLTMSVEMHVLHNFADITDHVTITVQGDDSNYFVHEDWEFNRKPVALGMESGKTIKMFHIGINTIVSANVVSQWIRFQSVFIQCLLSLYGVARYNHSLLLKMSPSRAWSNSISTSYVHLVDFRCDLQQPDLCQLCTLWTWSYSWPSEPQLWMDDNYWQPHQWTWVDRGETSISFLMSLI